MGGQERTMLTVVALVVGWRGAEDPISAGGYLTSSHPRKRSVSLSQRVHYCAARLTSPVSSPA